MFSSTCGILLNGSSGLSSLETVIKLIVPFPLSRRLMPIRRTLRILKAGSVTIGFRIYSKRQGGLQHCSRLVSVTTQKSPAISITDGRALSFLILFKDYNPSYVEYGDIAGAKIRRKTEICRENRRNSEKIREKLEIICKFLCISGRIICIFLIKIIQIIAPSERNHTDIVLCFTQLFCTFTLGKSNVILQECLYKLLTINH